MTLQLAVDVREACRKERTGKGQWTFGFVSELLRRQVPVTLVTDIDIPKEWEGRCPVALLPGRGMRWHLQALRWLRVNRSVTYVSPVSYIVPAFAPRSAACIPVVHDLIAFMNEPHDRKATWIERRLLPRVVRKCRRICTVSDATKQDLLARFPALAPERVTPVYAGPDHLHPEQNRPDGKTILCIATLCPRKNQLGLIRAFASLPAELRKNHRLVLAGGRGWHDEDIVRESRNLTGVEWTGYIDASRYASLLGSCTVFALPSLYEGFGMQILDAFQRGIPVLTSDRGSLRELAEGAALIVDPEKTDSIAAGLGQLLSDASLRSSLAEKGRQRAASYSWRKTVDLFLASV